MNKQKAFTLLEVLVALALCGFALGSVFMLLGGSKELAWKANQQMAVVNAIRARVNESQLHNNRGDLNTDLDTEISAERGGLESFPPRKTQNMQLALEKVTLQHPEKGELFTITRFKHLELPR